MSLKLQEFFWSYAYKNTLMNSDCDHGLHLENLEYLYTKFVLLVNIINRINKKPKIQGPIPFTCMPPKCHCRVAPLRYLSDGWWAILSLPFFLCSFSLLRKVRFEHSLVFEDFAWTFFLSPPSGHHHQSTGFAYGLGVFWQAGNPQQISHP